MHTLIEHAKTILFRHKYLHFFMTGTSGVVINLFITWLLTTLVFGLPGYFKAYIIGTTINLIYNFALHTKVTFQTKKRHVRRFAFFVAYSLLFTVIQAYVVRTLTPIIGLHLYLFVIAATIFVFSCITFLFFKFFLFREDNENKSDDTPQEYT